MREEIYLTDSKNNIQFLEDTIGDLSDELYSKPPAENKWSIQLILDHLSVTEAVCVNLSKGPTIENERDPSKMIHKIKVAFGNHKIVYPNPKAVSPTGQNKTKEAFLSVIKEHRLAYLEELKLKGANHLLDLYPHPIAGKMTRLEWLYFNIYHVERHIHQIKMIMQNPDVNEGLFKAQI